MYLKNRSAQPSVRAATLRKKQQIKFAISSSHCIPTLGQPFLALTLQGQAPGRVAMSKAMSKSSWLDWGHSQLILVSPTLEAHAVLQGHTHTHIHTHTYTCTHTHIHAHMRSHTGMLGGGGRGRHACTCAGAHSYTQVTKSYNTYKTQKWESFIPRSNV